MLVTRPGSDDLTHSLSLISNLSRWSSKVESVGSTASLALGGFLFGLIMENMREYNLDCNKFVEHKIRQPSWLADRWPVSVHVTGCLGLNFRTRPHSTLRKKEEKTKFWGRLVESVVFQKAVIESSFDYWIKTEYEYWIVHFMNGLLNEQTKSFSH